MALHGGGTTSLTRRGDIFPLQTIILFLILILLIVLVFGLFWVQALRFHDNLSNSTTATQSAQVSFGGIALRTYLSTRLDEPIENFLPPNVQGVSVGSAPLTMADALLKLKNNPECLQALKREGVTYPPANRDDFVKLFQTSVPQGLCRTFFLRTILFWRVVAQNDTFFLDTSDFKLGFGGDEVVLRGEQSLPGGVSVSVTLGTTPLTVKVPKASGRPVR